MLHTTFDIPFRKLPAGKFMETLRDDFCTSCTPNEYGERIYDANNSNELRMTGAGYEHSLIEHNVEDCWVPHAIRVSFSPSEATVGHSLFLENNVQLAAEVAEFVLADILCFVGLNPADYNKYFDLKAIQLIEATAAFYVKFDDGKNATKAADKLFKTLKTYENNYPPDTINKAPIRVFIAAHDRSCFFFYAMSDPTHLIKRTNFPLERWALIPKELKYLAKRFVMFEANLTREWLSKNDFQKISAWDQSAYSAVQTWLVGAVGGLAHQAPKIIQRMTQFTTDFDVPLQWERYYFGPKAAITFLPELARIILPK